MIKRFYEHSFDTSIIEPNGWSIDFGCGNDFYISKTFLDFGLKVIAVDPNPSIVNPLKDNNLFFEHKALTTNKNEKIISLNIYNDEDAATIHKPKNDVYFVEKKDVLEVETITIEQIIEKYNVALFEIIKVDIEGGEYDFLMSIDKPIAKQISVEFHDFRGLNPNYPNNEKYYEDLFKKLSKYYKVVKHDLEQHPGIPGRQGINYWDSLFILK